jgi:hypothetical protein
VSGKWPELNPELLASLAEGARPDHLTIEWREFQFAQSIGTPLEHIAGALWTSADFCGPGELA